MGKTQTDTSQDGDGANHHELMMTFIEDRISALCRLMLVLQGKIS